MLEKVEFGQWQFLFDELCSFVLLFEVEVNPQQREHQFSIVHSNQSTELL